MLRRRSIDKYIQQATAGLPQLERIDTAAELRVHLLQKTRELMAQGFPREEAEHLAVQEMGPVAETNRALLGHIFTPRFGWWVLGFTALTIAAWTGWSYRYVYYWPKAEIRISEITTPELSRALEWSEVIGGSHTVYDITVPRGTKNLVVGAWRYSRKKKFEAGMGAFDPRRLEPGPNGDWENPRARLEPTTVRLFISEGRSMNKKNRAISNIMMRNNGGGTGGGFGEFWTSLGHRPSYIRKLNSETIELNKWIPVAVYIYNGYAQEAVIVGVLASDSNSENIFKDRSKTSQTHPDFPRKVCLVNTNVTASGTSGIEIVQMRDKTSTPTVANGCASSR